jgi:hypothetical protein
VAGNRTKNHRTGGRGGRVQAKGGDGAGAAPLPVLAGSKGRVLDHIGFEVKDLKAFTERLASDGQKLDMPYTDASARIEFKIALITDPNGTYIELTEGLNAK